MVETETGVRFVYKPHPNFNEVGMILHGWAAETNRRET
jgi:hypothetical protein